MTDYRSRKFIVTILGLVIVLAGGWLKGIDTAAVGIIVLGYNGANAAVKASAQISSKRRR